MNANRPLVGRQKEIEQLCRSYAEHSHVLIVGIAGIGKTVLLREVAQYFLFSFVKTRRAWGEFARVSNGNSAGRTAT